MSDRAPMSGTPDCGGDAAAYVLGALEPHEADAFRLHMQECAVCRDEVEALSGAVQALPMAVDQYEPPRDLKRQVMRELGRESAGRARSRSPWRAPRELIAGLAAAALAAGGAVAAIELSAGVAATVIPAQVTGKGSAQLRVSGDRAELVVRHISPAGRGQVYEVWLQSGRSAPVPASVLFGVGASGDADVGIPRRIHGVSAVMVTREPLGGTLRPTHAPVIVARLD